MFVFLLDSQFENVVEVNETKEWRCIVVGHHDSVGEVVMDWEKNGWKLHTYSTAGMGGSLNYTVNHYLLFFRGE